MPAYPANTQVRPCSECFCVCVGTLFEVLPRLFVCLIPLLGNREHRVSCPSLLPSFRGQEVCAKRTTGLNNIIQYNHIAIQEDHQKSIERIPVTAKISRFPSPIHLDRYFNVPSSHPPHLAAHHSSEAFGPPPSKRAPPPPHPHPSFGLPSLPPPPPPREQHIPPFHGHAHRRPVAAPPREEPADGFLPAGYPSTSSRGALNNHDDDVDVSSPPSPSRGDLTGSSAVALAAAEAMMEEGDSLSPTPSPFQVEAATAERRNEDGRTGAAGVGEVFFWGGGGIAAVFL